MEIIPLLDITEMVTRDDIRRDKSVGDRDGREDNTSEGRGSINTEEKHPSSPDNSKQLLT